jgi:hypothetical protein
MPADRESRVKRWKDPLDENRWCEVTDRDDDERREARSLRNILKAMWHAFPEAVVDRIKMRLDLIEHPLRRSSSSSHP